ncbi:S8 family peptidase [Gottfriedia acidiceleris]|uniref:S8 family peptidase n=1 Tax=Gottfriedia acidiceleris TaxID=371036 RepID=UPI00101C4E54|nr:S8/S53 family peptidase [Gottfriedia acidiceleris]
MNYLMPIFIIAFILSLFLHKYLHLDKYPLIKKFTIGLIIILIIGSIFFIYTNVTLGKKDYGWQADYMNYNQLHKYSTGKSQKIALIDSGISKFQKEDNNSITLTGKNEDENGHGTMMYSIIKGEKNEVLGISPDAEVISIKIMNSEEGISPSLMVQAVEKAIELNCTIINMSIGSYKFNEELSNLIDIALKKGITIVSSSGDYSSGDMMFPANKEGVISVGSISANKRVSDFTNAPENTTINAPGDEIRSYAVDNKIVSNSGTSQATAIISGYVALLRDYASRKDINLSNDQLKMLLSSIKDGKSNYVNVFTKIKK